jgi:hypothetical protein
MVDDDRRVTIDLPFETAVGAAAGAIQREGLTILARIDVRDHFKTELHHEFRQYMLGAIERSEASFLNVGDQILDSALTAAT